MSNSRARSGAEPRDAGVQALHNLRVPLLPIVDRVLLPTSLMTVRVGGRGRRTKRLAMHLAASGEERGLPRFVAVAPFLTRGLMDAASAQQVVEEAVVGDVADGLYSMAALARASQVTLLPETGEYLVVLEGVGRVSAGAIEDVDGYLTARVSPMGLVPTPPGEQAEEGQGRGANGSSNSDNAAGEGPVRASLAESLRGSVAELLALVGQATGAPTDELAGALERVPAHVGADLILSVLCVSLDDRLEALATANPTSRVKLAIEAAEKALALVRSTLAGIQGGGRRGGAAARLPRPGPAPSQRARLLTPGAGLGSGGVSPGGIPYALGDGGDDGYQQLQDRLQAAAPPEEVMRVAMRELRRARKMGEQQPGHAAAMQYVELIAELPWRRWAADLATEAANAANGAEGGAGKEGEQTGVPRPLQDPSTLVACRTLSDARALLDREHYGLGKVKDRIIQYLAVRRLRGSDTKGAILCFAGPPGVGKTSLARSVAHVLGRPLQRIALGGVRDEAEIRGHRRTYVGAMPGRVLQAMRKARCRDPVLLLDEVDKVGRDIRGDPASALLEVLDPEQNAAFTDTYLALPFPLDAVVFLCTANRLEEVPAPLLDRLEVIPVSGYTLHEKVAIARTHVLPKVVQEHGLAEGSVDVTDALIGAVVEGYTREAGVRGLGRCLAALCRHVAVARATAMDAREGAGEGGKGVKGKGEGTAEVVRHTRDRLREVLGGGGSPLVGAGEGEGEGEGKGEGGEREGKGKGMGAEEGPFVVTEEVVAQVLGPRRFTGPEARERVTGPGAVAGLVWTSTGGAVQYVECARVAIAPPGRPGMLKVTGQVGEVLGESAQIALSWVRSRAAELGIPAGGAAGAGGRPGGRAPAPETYGDLGFTFAPGITTPGVAPGGGAAAVAEGRGDGAAIATASAPLPGDASSPALPAPRGLGEPSNVAVGAVGAGEVMERSAAHCWDVHVHLPAGAVPKDGPSAGVTLVTALVSLFTGRTVRADTAMTGEVTLRGLVLPVGGIKEKLLAAHRAGMRQVLVPHRNLVDVENDVPREVREEVEIVGVHTVGEVLARAFPGGRAAPAPRM